MRSIDLLDMVAGGRSGWMAASRVDRPARSAVPGLGRSRPLAPPAPRLAALGLVAGPVRSLHRPARARLVVETAGRPGLAASGT